MRPIGDYATVFAPGRFKRSYAVPGEEYVPYLRPYDVFEYLPPEADRLSVARTENLDGYRIESGMLLQTCSGRNLGPLTVADEYLARFVLSHDMVRITISNELDRLYTLAFLQTPIGQHLLRGDLNGSVIDHISDTQVRAIQVPFIESITGKVAKLMKRAVALRQRSRITLHDAVEALNNAIDIAPDKPLRDGWTVKAASLGTRLDAAYHSMRVQTMRDKLLAAGGVELGSVATITKPGGRYKTYYVAPGHGTPLLSGRQILQADPIGAKHISSRSITKDTGYELRSGVICFQADGRAEESLGYPSMVTSERDGWLASGHVGRAAPKSSDDAGWLWASLACDAVREQVAALACGSVVDALYPEDLENVVLPPRELVDSASVAAAWEGFADAAMKAAEARRMVEMELAERGVAG
ncbi:hypothetical protein O984_09405 [Mycobacterium avium 05-4293]|nr:hypothetical protein O984_09405 [Mycobacterium avium 05-4293]